LNGTQGVDAGRNMSFGSAGSEVQRIIDDVVAVQPKFARGHYWLGLIWKFLNEPERAER